MSEYTILVLGSTGSWESLDLSEDPVITYQRNTLFQLAKRQVNYSQSIKIPKTRRNIRILGFPDVPIASTKTPYQDIPCRILCSGIQLLSAGYKLILCRVSKDFECQIVSTVQDVFETLKSVKMSELDFGYADWTNAGITATNGADGDVQYMLIEGDPERDLNNYTQMRTVSSKGCYVRHIPPCVRFRSVINKIFEHVGFSLSTNLDNPEYAGHRNDFIPVTTERNEDTEVTDVSKLDGTVSGIHTMPIGSTNPFYFIRDNSVVYDGAFGCCLVGYDNPDDDVRGVKYIASHNMTVSVTASLNFTVIGSTGGEVSMRVAKVKRGSWNGTKFKSGEAETIGVIEIEPIPTTGSFSMSIEREDIELDEGDMLFIVIARTQGTISLATQYIVGVSVTVQDSGEFIHPGSTFKVSPQIPFESAFEAVQSFVRLYGLSVDVDGNSIVMNTLKVIYDNAQSGDFKNWSKKLIVSDDIVSEYVVGEYSQNNTVSFEESDSGFVDSTEFSVDNKSIPVSGDALEFPFKSFELARIYVGSGGASFDLLYVPAIPVRELAEDGLGVISPGLPIASAFKDLDIEPHVIRRTPGPFPYDLPLLWFSPFSGFSSGRVAPATAYGVGGNIAAAEGYLLRYFGEITDKLLNRAKLYECKMLLTLEDIHTLDFFKPVYVDSLAGFMYVSQVVNFIAGKPSKVKMLKM